MNPALSCYGCENRVNFKKSTAVPMWVSNNLNKKRTKKPANYNERQHSGGCLEEQTPMVNALTGVNITVNDRTPLTQTRIAINQA